MKMVKMLAVVAVVAVGIVGASMTMGEDAVPAVPTPPAVTSTNVCPKCGMTIGKCDCQKHGKGKHHKKDAACTNCTDKATCTNAVLNAVSK